ncbi:hypothetical protein SPRG_16122 [Saprolegnia parasitica CBS 223.65]|uniref:FAR-17a/AIG1-like protein n=1 Tax=Saprolegnia parasitica (strain CBS 223.65) TaxID=695850 RepID=A0A067BV58_SAPPC|nr:hypothetical protein SPRG_16122 [Saprolegnia parasitica CBS 223.65]KDO18517.1 hypothetical protein SPRG_16122 [Saprolegnia parasitica CBS 223.65]|eukprot:XP_012210777.1 hypothetical protein SPRG_16122 [Saprolegnia parasitica CBS 223.65]
MLWVQVVIGAILALALLASMRSIHHLRHRPHRIMSFQYPSPWAYYVHLGFRAAVVGLYIAVLVVETWYLGTKTISYYTVWNFILQGIYYLWAIKYQLSTYGSRNGPTTISRKGAALNGLFDICFANSLLVIVVYWGLLYNPNMRWYSYIQHGGNTLLFLIEFALNGFLTQRTSVVFIALFPAMYAIFIWISNVTWLNGWWPYSFLAMSSPVAPLWYIAVFVGHFVMYGAAYGISLLKAKLLPTCCPVLEKNALPIVATAQGLTIV